MTDNTTPIIDPKAVSAALVRYAVPAIVGLVVSYGAKAGLKIDATQAYAVVAPIVATAYATLAKVLEAKFPVLNRLLGAQKPPSLVK